MILFKILFWSVINIFNLFASILHIIGWIRKNEGIKASMHVTVLLFILGLSLTIFDFAYILNRPVLIKLGISLKYITMTLICYSLPIFVQSFSSQKKINKTLQYLKYLTFPLWILIAFFLYSPNDILSIAISIIQSLILVLSTLLLAISKHKKNIPLNVSKVAYLIPMLVLILLPALILENFKFFIPVINYLFLPGHTVLPLIMLIRNGFMFIIMFNILIYSSRLKALTDIDLSIFTEKEKQIVLLFLLGKTYKLIADELQISPNTVGSHINKIYQKTYTSNRMELYQSLVKNNSLRN